MGTGSTLSGVGEYLKSKNPEIKIVAIEPENSSVLSEGKAGPHKIQGIGAGFVLDTLNTEIYDEIIRVTNQEAYEAGRDIARTEGILRYFVRRINEIFKNYQAWKKQNGDQVVFVIINNLQFIDIVKAMLKGEQVDENEFFDEANEEPKVDPNNPFAAVTGYFETRSNDDGLSVGDKLLKLISDGSGFGIHFIVTCLEYQTVRECMYYEENVLTKFPERIIFSLGSNDADNPIENVSVSGLRDNTVYLLMELKIPSR